jgi:hypothetical protein
VSLRAARNPREHDAPADRIRGLDRESGSRHRRRDPKAKPGAAAAAVALLFAAAILVTPRRALAQSAAYTPPTASTITPTGYVETYYQWNFNNPSNGITNFRGFDNRHDSITLENVVFGASWRVDRLDSKLLLQVGSTPATYYGSEPDLPGTAGANATNKALWMFVQEAHVGWHAPTANDLFLEMGLFPSPIGPEVFAINQDWNWSRSNLFFALPFYHTGFRATYFVTGRLATTLAAYNGWNSIVDNNQEKSVSGSVGYRIADRVNAQILYFGGVERPTGAPEGPYWRHDFDAYVEVDPRPIVNLMVHGNAGWEPNRFGTSSWYAGALYARIKALRWLWLAARADYFHENEPTGATPIFWPLGTSWVTEGTVTLDFRPTPDNLSVRLEYRHDSADNDLYFLGTVAGSGLPTDPFVPNARSQDTVTLGATGWF